MSCVCECVCALRSAMHCRKMCIEMKCKWTWCTQGCWRSFVLEMLFNVQMYKCTSIVHLHTAQLKFFGLFIRVWRSHTIVRQVASHSLYLVPNFFFSRFFWPYFYNLLFLSVSDHQLFFSSHAKKCRQSKINNIRTCLPNHMYATRDCRTKIRDMQTFIINSSSAKLSWA